MKSLFLKIFLSFWLAIALFVVLAILVVMVFRPQRNPTWESLRSTALADAISARCRCGATLAGPIPRQVTDGWETRRYR